MRVSYVRKSNGRAAGAISKAALFAMHGCAKIEASERDTVYFTLTKGDIHDKGQASSTNKVSL
jgi:hypothetical protein